MKTNRAIILTSMFLLFIQILLVQCTSEKIDVQRFAQADTAGVFLVNQVGYLPYSSKVALIRTKTEKFHVIDAQTGKIVFTGLPGKREYWSFSGDSVSLVDFSKLDKAGKYRLCIDGYTPCSYEFAIGDSVYHALAKASIKAFYYNRASIEIAKEFGGKWARPMGHCDSVVIIHPSAASEKRPAGTIISSAGGWYDAGDYNKYVVNSGISTYTLLLFYQLFPEYCEMLSTNIPESKNDIPDVVDELLWNLKWMLTMQDPNDGGVYHKLTNRNFDGFVLPNLTTTPRYVVQKSTAAALDFAATMAMASRVFENDHHAELKKLSPICLSAAKKAMEWAKKNPAIYYDQPADITTGKYDDTIIKDEFFWANSEMALATNDLSLVKTSDIDNQELITPSWDRVEMLGMISLALTDNDQFKVQRLAAAKRLVSFTDLLLSKFNSSPYRTSLDFFKWGSNSDVANQTMLQLIGFRLTHNKNYLTDITGNVDYLLGKNPTTYCFVSGFGTHSPMNIHHRPSGGDTVVEPVPGFMAGGPNTIILNDCGDSTLMKKRSLFPAKSYSDVQCSFSTNEIAINWNAPLFFIVGALDALGLKK